MAETIFSKVDYTLGNLIEYIELGEIALPDIQRPFVWKNIKVRDLFDSMYRGYPVGYFLFWQNSLAETTKNIGEDNKQKSARLLIVDGQQRLTSLYAVIKGETILRENFSKEKIAIAFNPLTESFEVADAAIKNNKLYLPNISEVWENDLFDVVDEYMGAAATVKDITDEERKNIRRAIQRVHSLTAFPLTAIELSGEMDEEKVAEVFVRINSKGKQLNQADFILTLMSVYWEEGRRDLEAFCQASRIPTTGEASSFNHYLQPDPDQLLRVAVGLAFSRARLKYVYAILRGKNLETDETSPELREAQFAALKEAQKQTIDVQNWHEYLKALRAAGYRGANMISSKTGIVYCYLMYLIGKVRYNVDHRELRRVIAQWYFMVSMTARYSSSAESQMEVDLANLREVKTADEFCATLRRACDEQLTNDYWAISLPSDLTSAAGRSPAQNAFFAALNLLEAKVLFSEQMVSESLDPATKAKRAAVDKHHLFPKAYLAKNGITSRRQTNQQANLALLEWRDNNKASAKAPADYLPELSTNIDPADLERMYYWHALPDGWEKMKYEDFLLQRRERIGSVIKDAYAKICGEASKPPATSIDVNQLVETGESDEIEFKSTLRINLHTQQKDAKMELAVLRTIAGFLNRKGGKLVIGVSDDGEALGLEIDGFPNEDKMNLHLVNLINSKIGKQYMMYIAPRFEDYEEERAFVVECQASRSPVFVKKDNQEVFYVRSGASTSELTGNEMQEYIRRRFD